MDYSNIDKIKKTLKIYMKCLKSIKKKIKTQNKAKITTKINIIQIHQVKKVSLKQRNKRKSLIQVILNRQVERWWLKMLTNKISKIELKILAPH